MFNRSVWIGVVALFVTVPAGAAPGPPGWLVPPVDGAVTRGWIAPAHEFGPGHRGIDYAVPEGTLVRAAAPGTVSFAGVVAGVRAVTLQHADGLATTYTSLSEMFVRGGEDVEDGRWIGRAGVAHAGGEAGLHFGVKLNGAYVDPAEYLGPVGIADAIHLAPTVWRPPDVLTEGFRSAFDDPGSYRWGCRAVEPIGPSRPPPNDNLAIAIAGIGSKTAGGVSADMYEHGPEQLGYSHANVYRFSYAGARGPLLHEPFTRGDSFGDLRVAARRLRSMVMKVGRREPGRHVDLIAHSQGGIVARLFLQSLQRSWDPRLPVVDHLVTLSTPHTGAPLAGDIEGLDRTLTGGFVLDAVSAWTKRGGPVPDPRSVAAAQLAPGSELLSAMAKEDVAFGTRVLALGIANDPVVPPDRARLFNEPSRTLAPAGLNGHSGIVSSPDALALAYAFLRNARPTCPDGWDVWGPRLGRVVSWGEARVPAAVRRVEAAVGGLGAMIRAEPRPPGGEAP
jgi:hypothetical protein